MSSNAPSSETRNSADQHEWLSRLLLAEFDIPIPGRLRDAIQWTVRLLSAVLFVYAAIQAAHVPPGIALGFLGLSIVSRLLRVPVEGTLVQLEAAAVFPAVLLSGSWAIGPVLAAIASLCARLLERRGKLRLLDADEAADLVFTYGAASYFFSTLAPASPGSTAGFLLFAGTVIVFSFFRILLYLLRGFVDGKLSGALLKPVLYQFFAVVLVSPVVAVTVMVHPQYGFTGTLLAFTSVALASASLRNLARVRRRSHELARQNQELLILREISSAYASGSNTAETAPRVVRALRQVLPFSVLAMATKSQGADPPDIWFDGKVPGGKPAFLDWWEKNESAFHETTPLRAPTVHSGTGRDMKLDPNLTYQVRVVLQTQERVFGILVCESDDSFLSEPGTLRALSVMADHIALSMQDRSLRNQMQKVNQRLRGRAATLQRILEISNDLKSHLTIEKVLENVVRAVHTHLGYDSVLLMLYNRADSTFEPRAQVGLDNTWREISKKRPPRDEILQLFADKFRISKSYFITSLERSAGEDDVDETRSRSGTTGAWEQNDLLIVPLTSGDQLFGYLQVSAPRSGRTPTLEDVQALEIFGNQAVTAIQSARAYENTRNLSVRDSLTNTYNHRYFQEVLHREISRHERKGQTLGLIMVDIDDFKKINDCWGHPAGDMILKGLVEELQNGVRDMDTVARYGGEEFAIILPETSTDNAAAVAERLRSRVASRVFLSPDVEKALNVTISIGVAIYPFDATNKRDLIDRADQALYKAKRAGKNRVVRAQNEEVQSII